MADSNPQTLANHTRLDPLFHFFILPVAAITLLITLWEAFQDPRLMTLWMAVLASAGVAGVLKIRLYALKVQDRVIRLEERMRLSSLLSGQQLAKLGDLTEAQLVAIRFASDGEVAALVEKTLSAKLKPKEIKQAIANWRADFFRV